MRLQPFGAFPVLRQDIAVVLPETISAREVGHAVRRAGGNVLGSAEIFDVYTSEQVGEGRRSLALALSFRSLEGTLTDEDVAPVRERIVAARHEGAARVAERRHAGTRRPTRSTPPEIG